MDITDLDVLVPEPKTVRFGGAEYRVPADLPMEIFLRLNRAAELKGGEGESDTEAQVNGLRDAIADLFIWEMEEQPGYTEDQGNEVRANVSRVLRKRGTRYTFQLIRNIYKDEDEDNDAPGEVIEGREAPAPADEASSGTTSSSTLPSPTTPTVIPAASSA